MNILNNLKKSSSRMYRSRNADRQPDRAGICTRTPQQQPQLGHVLHLSWHDAQIKEQLLQILYRA